ncbi:MAG: hypothetical protein PHU79_05595 [Oscillospiraceae bacterium]|nr:hypothetical protein [Oscillospiraceae bacterium]
MNIQTYSTQQRRALNQIWTAAGDYHFEPQFLALDSGGKPNFYMNCIVGLVHKWYGEIMPKALFAAWAGDVRQAQFDDLAWLALENAAYERELPFRPVLKELRAAHAKDFFAQEYQLSRQQWMAKNQLVYALQAARWRRVLGQHLPVLSVRNKKLDAALACSGALSGPALSAEILKIFRENLGFSGTPSVRAPFKLHFSEKWVSLLTKLLPIEMVRTDKLTVNRSAAAEEGDAAHTASALRAKLNLQENAQIDKKYIEDCFGRSLYPPKELAAVEQQLCTGNHLGCHLWFTDGVPAKGVCRSGESERLAEQAALQEQRNRKAYEKAVDVNRGAIVRLAGQIRNYMLLQQQPEEVAARCGRLNSSRVWREPLLRDERVFLRREAEEYPGFSVDLMLDASASRLHCQELIAAQGYILAESLRLCGISVQVSSFCSLRGYTVLRVLKPYQDKSADRNIFRYFAAGWNRDGLALRAAGELMKSGPEQKHLLLLLTDANPNDSHRVPPGEKFPLSRDYGGELGVADAAAEVSVLRGKGIRTAAIFMGENSSAPAAKTIFGRDMVRIRRMDQLAVAAGRLICAEILELGG